MERGKYWLSAFLLLVVLTSSIYFVLNDEVRIDIQNTKSIFQVQEDGKWVVAGIEYVNLFDGTTKMRASAREIEISTYGTDTIVTRTAQYKNNILVAETYIFNSNTSGVTLFPVSHTIEVIGADRPGRPYILQYEVQKLLYTGETINRVESPQSFGHQMKVEWEDGNYYSRIFKYSGKDEGKLTVKYRIDSNRFSKNVRLFDPPAPHLSSNLSSPDDNFITDTISNNFSSILLSNGSAIQNSSLYVKKPGGNWEIASTINFNTTNYNLDIYADSLNVAGFSINNVNATKIGDGVWRINSTESGSDLQRAQIIKTLFYGTNGADARATSTYITNPTRIISNEERDDGMRGYYSRMSSLRSSGYISGDIDIYPTNTTIWGYRGCDQNGNNCPANTHLLNGTIVLTMPFSSGDITNDYMGTTNYQTFAAAETHRLNGGSGSAAVSVTNKQILLTKGNVTFSFTETACGSGCSRSWEYINFYEDEGFPAIIYNGLSNFTINFTEDIINSAIWNIEVCNENGICNFSISNRSIYLDKFNPSIDITFPMNTSYIINVPIVNFTLIEPNPDSCWYSNDSGTTNSTSASAVNGSNYLDITSKVLQNTITVYCNDTRGNIGSNNILYTLDAIRYSSDSDTTNTSITGVGNVFINVTLNPLVNRQNISFRGYNLTGTSTIQYLSDSFTNSTNYTNLNSTTNPFYWDVILYDTSNVSYTLSTRHKGLEEVNFSMEGFFNNINAELGADIGINATSNISYVYIDIDHPDYGVNYSSGFLSTSLDLIINYFRANVFNDGLTFRVLEFIGTEIKTILFPAHQYDEVEGMSFNITGINTTQYPENIQINKSNLSQVDRLFPGFLIGNKIYLNKLNTNEASISLFYSGISTKSIEFWMDDGASSNRLSFDISGIEFGVDFDDDFGDFSNIDLIQTTAQLDISNAIMPANSSLTSFVFDDFDDGSISTEKWDVSSDFSQSFGGGNDCAIERHVTEQNGEIRLQAENTHGGSGIVNCGEGASYIASNDTKLNLYTSENILLELNATTSVDNDNTGCGGSTAITLGNTNVWESDLLLVAGSSSSTSKIIFNLTKFNSTHWMANLSGYEINTGGGDTQIYNWTTNTKHLTNGSTEPLTNPFFTAVDYGDSVQLGAIVEDVAAVSTCKFSFVNAYINIINNSLWSRSNSTVISKSIYDSSGDITTATVSTFGLIAPSETISFFLSADDGDNWEAVTLGLEHSFTFAGRHLRWRSDFNINDPGYKNLTSRITSVSITTPKGFPSDLTFDFGGDDIIDATFSGKLNNSNSPTTITISSADISSAFTGFSTYDHLFEVPLTITSVSVGELLLENFNLTYNPNPISLNTTSILNFINSSINFVDFPIAVESIGGNISIDDIRYDYAGGNDTIEITVHNADYSQILTRNITYYYSRWDYFWGPIGVEWIYFSPTSPTKQNVTPYGQTDTVPILSITNYGYGGRNVTLSILQDDTLACVNTTISLDSTKQNGKLIADDWVELTNLSYLEATDIYLWTDYSCNYSTWRNFQPNYYFRQCVDGGICSIDLI